MATLNFVESIYIYNLKSYQLCQTIMSVSLLFIYHKKNCKSLASCFDMLHHVSFILITDFMPCVLVRFELLSGQSQNFEQLLHSAIIYLHKITLRNYLCSCRCIMFKRKCLLALIMFILNLISKKQLLDQV